MGWDTIISTLQGVVAAEATIQGVGQAAFKYARSHLINSVSNLSTEIAQTPSEWNSDLCSIAETLSMDVMVPIAVIIITFLLAWDMVEMLTEKNNMHEFEHLYLIKWVFKTLAVFMLVIHAFEIVMGVMELGSLVVDIAAGSVTNSSEFTIQGGVASKLAVALLIPFTNIIDLAMCIFAALGALFLDVLLSLVTNGRQIMILLLACGSPIAFATAFNKTWRHIFEHYIKTIIALALQAFYILLLVSFITVLFASLTFETTTLNSDLTSLVVLEFVFIFTLTKTESLAKQVLGMG